MIELGLDASSLFLPTHQPWHNLQFLSGYQLAQRLGMSPQLAVKVTGSILMTPKQDPNKPFQDSSDYKNKINIGLNLRHNKKGEEVLCY